MHRLIVRSASVETVSVVLASALFVVACMWPSAARAGCVAAVVVDGAVLSETDTDGPLPHADGRVSAVVPACNDGGPRQPNGRTELVRFAGIPADVAVRSLDGSQVYIAPGSLTALGAHPLHRDVRSRPRRRCARSSTLAGRAGAVGADLIELRAGAWSTFVGVDTRTVMVNRPVYQPIRRGQRLSIEATRCGTRLIADRIAFTGPTVVAARYVGQTNPAHEASIPWAIVLPIGALGLALALWLIERITRP
jgi:hypothetical protein